MKKLIIILTVVLCSLLLLSALNPVLAKKGTAQDGVVALPDPLGMGDDPEAPQKLIGKIINAILGIVGSLALVMFIYGGVTWMLAAGNQEKVKKGKDVIIWATVGLVVIFSAYALVKFVFTGLGVT